jgi:hypothetical protein
MFRRSSRLITLSCLILFLVIALGSYTISAFPSHSERDAAFPLLYPPYLL